MSSNSKFHLDVKRDKEAGAAYIRVRNFKTVARSIPVKIGKQRVVADYDEKGRLIGLELLNV